MSVELRLVAASKSKRLSNYLIDTFLFYVLLLILVLFLNDSLYYFLAYELDELSLNIIISFLIVIYYTILEYSLKGKTIGKYVSKTRSIKNDGSKPNLKTIFLRSLWRIIPFEVISFLGPSLSGWHDKWTKTRVIDEVLSQY